jgi:type II secretory pathway predicted ATPase ExeA
MKQPHPLERARGSHAKTAPVEEALRALNRVLRTPELGMVMVAPTRYGKSTFLDILEARFAQSHRAVVVRALMTTQRDRNWANKLWRRLRGEEEGAEDVFPQLNPKRALIQHIQNECDKAGTSVVVFALDEAQNLAIQELDLLKELSENLLTMGFKPFLLLVGQPELERLIGWLLEQLRTDIVQRFMLHKHVFRGLCGVEEVRVLLRHSDESVWPAGSGRTYTQHFVPTLWEQGWRVQSIAPQLWHAFVQHAASIGFATDKLDLGVQFVAKVQLALFQALSMKPDQPLTHELFRSLVEGSGFRQSKALGARTTSPKDEEARLTRRWLRGSGR